MNNFISFIIRGLSIIFRGLGQIFLQENAITGILFFIGIAINSWLMALGAFLGSAIGMGTGYIFKFNNKQIEQGLFGFSPALVGVGLILLFKPTLLVWSFILIGSVLAAFLQRLFLRLKLPVFTLPFVLVTWIGWLIFTRWLPVGTSSYMGLPSRIVNDDLFFGFRGIGQVIFQDNWLTGLLFFLGLFWNSRWAALYAIAGSIFCGIIADLFGMDIQDIRLGLLSFNGVLCAIVFAGDRLLDGLWVLVSLFVAVLISIWMLKMGWIQLTFPFVVSAFLFSVLKNRMIFGRFSR